AHLNRDESFARGMAYYTGPAYGLLLDAASPGWTRSFKPGDDLGAALKVEPGEPAPQKYAGDELRTDERRRDLERRERNARNRALFIEGPTLELPMANARYSFDPNNVFVLEGAGSVYPTLDVTADWGVLHAKEGALISSDFTRILVGAPADGAMSGPG